MKKLLLSLACVATLAANAETITLSCNNVDTAAIVGEFHPLTYQTDGTTVKSYANWQPVESLNMGDYKFTFTSPESGAAAAFYTAKEGGDWTVRVYNGCTMTITAPEGTVMGGIKLVTSKKPDSTFAYSVDNGTATLEGSDLVWGSTEGAAAVTLSVTEKNIQFKRVAITTGAGTEPTIPDTSGVAYDNACTSNTCGFTFEYANDGDFEAWTINSTYGLKASAYANSVSNATDSYAISPVIDLSGIVAPITYTYEDAVNQFKVNNALIDLDDLSTYIAVLVREENGEWVELAMPTHTAFNWNYVQQTVDLSAYAGKKIQLGYHYISTADCAGTWEIKNVKVAGTALSQAAIEVAGDAAVEYYNLQGVRVAEPTNGLYIRRQGNKAVKVLVK